MKAADYALTQPGTNTLEMMHCGLPALVAAPYDFLKVIPVSGVAGILSGVPLLGPYLKERAIKRGLGRYGGFMSWPNRLAGDAVMDEIAGDVNPKDIAQKIARALSDREKLKRARETLLAVSREGDEGREKSAAALFCDALESSCEGA
jgi:lipid-A-disaccharide synthase